MTDFLPTLHSFEDYLEDDPEELNRFLMTDKSKSRIRWRKDSADRITGGARRTYLPFAKPIDRPMLGGSPDFRKRMNKFVNAANRLMTDVDGRGWRGNRVVINYMPANATLHEHIDPEHFADSVVIFGLNRARFFYRNPLYEQVDIELPSTSLVVLPSGTPHGVENGGEDRFSVAVVNDLQLAAGRTAVGLAIDGLIHNA